MAKSNFDSKWVKSTLDAIDAASFFNNPGAGIQAEFENRQYVTTMAGVFSGLAASISTTSIAIASGEGYGTGKKYIGSESHAFTVADTVGTYYVYWDASAEALANSTTIPDTSLDILFCKVYWNGTDTLSLLVDLRVWGVNPLPLMSCTWSLSTVTTGKKGGFTVPPNTTLWIDAIAITQSDNGSASSTIVDCYVGTSGSAPTTIFATTANRPSVDNAVTNWTTKYSGVPDTRLLTAGQNVYVSVTQVGTASQDLIVTVYGRRLLA